MNSLISTKIQRMMEKQTIALEGMKFYAYHGYYESERKIGGHFLVDVYMRTHFDDAKEKDDLNGTIDYENVYSICKEQMAVPSKLLEHVTGRIVDHIYQTHPQLLYIKLRLSKMNPPIQGQVTRTYIEIEKNFA